ncbi:hypothetical protein KP509_12G054000 [Ceratopteris richardii]|uniref:CCHC-type domain-containing protein n=1 Tax=Ceratopteris richardii TaxID=49495 RepID=A0A8T2TPN7_CERRI|nr:hypothetical protein KP509_12G054000 [Ceratopteris richardii]
MGFNGNLMKGVRSSQTPEEPPRREEHARGYYCTIPMRNGGAQGSKGGKIVYLVKPLNKKKPIMCYRCGEYGHFQSRCPLPEGSPPCKHCLDATDHYSKDCPKLRPSTSQGRLCGQQPGKIDAGVLTRAQRKKLEQNRQKTDCVEEAVHNLKMPCYNEKGKEVDKAYKDTMKELQRSSEELDSECAIMETENLLKSTYKQTPTTDSRSPTVTLTIRGKIFTGVIIDRGSGINLMPHYTMLSLGLEMTRRASFTVTLADQSRVQPLGIVEEVPILIQNNDFFLSFVVVDVPRIDGGYPLLIGRPWLRHHQAVHDWSNDTLLITTGQARQHLHLDDKEFNMEDDEDLMHWTDIVDSFPCYGVNFTTSKAEIESMGLEEPILDYRRGRDKMCRYKEESLDQEDSSGPETLKIQSKDELTREEEKQELAKGIMAMGVPCLTLSGNLLHKIIKMFLHGLTKI